VSVGVAYLLYRIFSRDHSDRSAAATVAAETHADGENVTAAQVTTPPVSTPPGPERPRPSKADTLITLALALLAAGTAPRGVRLPPCYGETATAVQAPTPPVSTPPGRDRPRPSKAYTLITLALALLAAGIAAGWVHLNGVTTERGGILSTSPAAIAALLAATG